MMLRNPVSPAFRSARIAAAHLATAWVLAVVALAASSGAQAWPRYDTREQSVPERITTCVIQDLNRDGCDDAFVVLGRAWWLFQGSDKGLRPVAKRPRGFRPDVVAFDVDPSPVPDRPFLLARRFEDGRVDVPVEPGAPEPSVDPADPTVLRAPTPVHHAPLFCPLPGPDTPTLPVPEGSDLVFCPVAGPEEAAADRSSIRIHLRPDRHVHLTGDSLFDRIVSESTPPVVRIGDLTGDGRRDIILVSPTRLVFHRSPDRGRFPPEPTGVFPLGPQSVGTRLFHVTLPPILVDLDGDRDLDLVDIDANGGLIRVHRGPLDRPEATVATERLRFQGPLLDVAVMDVNGDGRPDLRVLATETVSLLSGVQMFLTQRMPARLLTFCQRPDRSLPARPDAAHDLWLPVAVDTGETPPKAVPVMLVDFRHDLDQDGRPDLVRHLNRRTLGIFPGGTKHGELASRPVIRLTLPGDRTTRWERLRVGDFNGDRKPDVLTTGWSAKSRSGVLAAFLSRKP